MRADGFIVDPTNCWSYEVRCHQCARPLYENDPPINQHHECLDSDGRLAVCVEIENYEDL